MKENQRKTHVHGIKPDELKALSKRVSYYWIRDLMFDWIVMIGSFVLVGFYPSVLSVVLAIFAIANRQHALALLGHDGTHCTISYNTKFNDFLTNYFTWIPIGLTLEGYRNLHKYHHSELGTENDPEIVYKSIRSEQWNLPKTTLDVFKLAILDMLGNGIPDYKVILQYSKPQKSSDYLPLLASHAIMCTIMIWLGLWWVPAIWYFSLVTGFIMFFRLRLWLEHHGTDTTHRLHLNWWQGPLLAPHLSWHHWEHHNWPSIPYHNLPKLRKLITTKPIMSLSDLITYYKQCAVIPAGTALKEARRPQGKKNPAFS
ncbi:MAG: fatty acid desaturase [Alphaproteobacteria bacterium]